MYAVATAYFGRGSIEGAALAAPTMATYEESFLAAFDEHSDALFRHARFRLSNSERAADLTQETFLKAWEYARAGNEVRAWKSFLYRILNNLIIDEYRRTKEESLDTLLEDDPPSLHERMSTGGRRETEDRLDDTLMIEHIKKFIPELPYGLRSALTLRYIDGFSPKEIAGLLDVSENVASVRIHRAVVRLRELCKNSHQP